MADENPTDQGAAGVVPDPRKEDLNDQGVVLILVLDNFPTQLRVSDLVREITDDSGDFQERDRVERAMRDLVAAGLLFRCEALVLPTRSAIRFHELQGG
jgi:hypothetical protein